MIDGSNRAQPTSSVTTTIATTGGVKPNAKPMTNTATATARHRYPIRLASSDHLATCWRRARIGSATALLSVDDLGGEVVGDARLDGVGEALVLGWRPLGGGAVLRRLRQNGVIGGEELVHRLQ